MDILAVFAIVFVSILASAGAFAALAWAVTADIDRNGTELRALIAQQYMDSVDYADVDRHLGQDDRPHPPQGYPTPFAD